MAADKAADGTGHGSSIDPQAVGAQLQRILGSATFRSAKRRRDFLRHVVDETLAGRAGRIKAYSIGLAVYGRAQDFDPQLDPIVRIEAGRLRAALERYYQGEGAADSLRIHIPLGAYVPSFEGIEAPPPPPLPVPPPPTPLAAERAPVAAQPRRRRALLLLCLAVALVAAVGLWWLTRPPGAVEGAARPWPGPAIFVQPFETEGDPGRTDIGKALTREIIADLTRFNDLVVFGPETSFLERSSGPLLEVARDLGAQYAIKGAVTILGETFRVSVAMIDTGSERYVWSREFTAPLSAESLFAAEDQIAAEIVRNLAQPYGAIFEDQVTAERARPPNSMTSYDCVLGFYQYRRNPAPESFTATRVCLETAVVDDPNYASAHSALALLYGDAVRFGIGRDEIPPDPLARALELARRAVDLEPRATHGYKALLLVYWLRHDIEASFEAAREGLALNPNDTELMADLGTRYCVVGRWDEGYPMLLEATARNPALGDAYRIVTFLKLYSEGRYEAALDEARRMNLPNLLDSHLAIAASEGMLGRAAPAAEAVRKVLELDPAFADHAVAYLTQRNLYPALVAQLLEGWRRAGMVIAGEQF